MTLAAVPRRGGISVLVSTYNRAPYLRECLDSLLTQTRAAIEIIVVNDGSTDQTKAILDEYEGRILAIHQENTGKPRAINRAFEQSQGEYIWIFDDDDVALPDSIERHAAVLDAHPEVGFTYASYHRGRDGDNGAILITEDAKVPCIDQDHFLIRLLENCFLTTQAMVIRRAMINGGYVFNPELIRSQDYELFIRLARSCQGRMIEGQTYIRRFHDGHRGSASDRFEISQIEEKWYRYEKIASAAFFQSADPAEFLPKPLAIRSKEPRIKYLALSQKAVILARKGLWDDLHTCLAQIGALRSDGTRPDPALAPLFSTALRKDLAIQELLTSTKLQTDLLHSLKSNLSEAEVAQWARGLWYTRGEQDNCLDVGQRRKSALLALRMLGPRGITYQLMQKMFKRDKT